MSGGVGGRHGDRVGRAVDDAHKRWGGVFAEYSAGVGPAQGGRLAAQKAEQYATHRQLGVALSDPSAHSSSNTWKEKLASRSASSAGTV